MATNGVHWIRDEVRRYVSGFESDITVRFDYDNSFVPIVVCAVTMYALLYKLLSPRISLAFSPTYRSLSHADQKEWNTRINSTVNALIVSTICLIMALRDDILGSNPLIYRSILMKTNISLILGYMIADSSIMVRHYRMVGDGFAILHHCVTVIAFFYVLTLDILPYLSNLRLMSEFSTLFVNLRWYMAVHKVEKTSPKFVINGILMTITFFFCRILIIPLFWYKVYGIYNSKLWNHLGHLRFVAYLVSATLDAVNIYWFTKIARGCHKVLRVVLRRDPAKTE